MVKIVAPIVLESVEDMSTLDSSRFLAEVAELT